MERLPDARAGWKIPNRDNPHIRAFEMQDSSTGVTTEWEQNLRLFKNRRIDAIPNSGFRRVITQMRVPKDHLLTHLPRVFSDRTSYDVEETLGDYHYSASLEDAEGQEPESQLRVVDDSARVWYNAVYKSGVLSRVEFSQTKIEAIEDKIEVFDNSLDPLDDATNLKELLDLVRMYGDDVFDPSRFLEGRKPGEAASDATSLSVADFSERAINWNAEERATIIGKVGVLLKASLMGFLPQERADSPEMSTIFQWLFRGIMRCIPRDFELKTAQEQMESFYDLFRFEVQAGLVGYKNSLTEVGEHTAILSFGLPTDPVRAKFIDYNGEELHTTDLQDGIEKHFDIYNFSTVRSPEGVLVAFRRLVKPQLRYEYRIPNTVSADEFRKIASIPDNTGWEAAKDIAWAQYSKS